VVGVVSSELREAPRADVLHRGLAAAAPRLLGLTVIDVIDVLVVVLVAPRERLAVIDAEAVPLTVQHRALAGALVPIEAVCLLDVVAFRHCSVLSFVGSSSEVWNLPIKKKVLERTLFSCQL